MTLYRCDHCKQTYENPNYIHAIRVDIMHDSIEKTEEDFDVCENCRVDFLQVVKKFLDKS